MNRLMGLKASQEYCVTLNLDERIDPKKVVKVIDYRHPEYSSGSRGHPGCAAQPQRPAPYLFRRLLLPLRLPRRRRLQRHPGGPSLRRDPMSAIYTGQVLHQRRGPQDHAFQYPLLLHRRRSRRAFSPLPALGPRLRPQPRRPALALGPGLSERQRQPAPAFGHLPGRQGPEGPSPARDPVDGAALSRLCVQSCQLLLLLPAPMAAWRQPSPR